LSLKVSSLCKADIWKTRQLFHGLEIPVED